MRFRGKSIRRKIVVVLLVPLVSLSSIWGVATYLTSRDAATMLTASDTMNRVNDPVHDTARALQRERRQTLVYLADPRGSDAMATLRRLERSTDKAVDKLPGRPGAELLGEMDPHSKERLDALLEGLDGLDELRTRVENSTITRGGAFQAYNELVDPCYTFLTSLHGIDDGQLEKEGRALVGVSRAREYLSREDALMSAALTAGTMTDGDQRAFSDRIAERNLALRTHLEMLPAQDRDIFESYWDGTDGRTLRGYEDAIIAAGSRGATDVVDSGRWQDATSTVLDDLQRLRFEAHERYHMRMEPAGTEVLLVAGGVGVIGLIAVLASIVISFRTGRSLIRDLNALRKEANESAGVRLPSVMRRLASGEQVDVETEAPRLEYPPDETGQVGQALNTLQRAAVEAAVKQADMRRGVSEVFVNLARRNQVLLHRQLTLLDTMERRTENSDELADLFRLDHLTTRMRRHAEGLVILSGAAPSRQWRKPVQLMDVVRAAVAEVEDYERIEVRRLPRFAVDGIAVADVTHLIAELLENATVFSPPHTAVQVLGERVANGFTLEIHDRGLGMTSEALLDANLRLAETPEFELSDTDRLGLFVVSRLALRQGVRVSLQPSPYGGTTAVVLIPGSVLTEPNGNEDVPERRAVSDGRREERTSGGERLTALTRTPPAGPTLERGGSRTPALDGPIELEAPLSALNGVGGIEEEEIGGQDADGDLFGRRENGRPQRQGGPERHEQHVYDDRHAHGGQHVHDDQHQQADEAAETARPPGAPTPLAPLPRRRTPGAPVLISDHGRRVEDGRHRPEQAAEAAGPETPEGEARTSPPEGPATIGGLPRRVRQASLAPQLKAEADDRAAPDAGTGPQSPAPSEWDADRVRNRMASLQRGWQRGRRHNDNPSGDDAGDTAPGTTPEGDGR